MDNQQEIWKDISGYEGLYKVSNLGKVYSVKRNKYMSLCYSNGYDRVLLSKNGKSKNIFVHRLVAQTFIPNPNYKPCIDHIDGNRANNNVNNLRWVSYKENNNNEITKNRISIMTKLSYQRGRKYPYDKLKKGVICIETGKEYTSITDAYKITGIHASRICLSCKNNKYSAGGYHWKYAEKKAC